MNIFIKFLFLLFIVSGIAIELNSLQASQKRTFDKIEEEFNLLDVVNHCKSYYEEKEEGAKKNDEWTTILKHPQAKKIKNTPEFPEVTREEYFHLLEDNDKQIETVTFLIDGEFKRIAALVEVEEENIHNEKDYLREQAIFLSDSEVTSLSKWEKELITLTNFKKYLEKNKPEALIPSTSLEDFMGYLTQKAYEIPEEKKTEVENYLKEYFFFEKD